MEGYLDGDLLLINATQVKSSRKVENIGQEDKKIIQKDGATFTSFMVPCPPRHVVL